MLKTISAATVLVGFVIQPAAAQWGGNGLYGTPGQHSVQGHTNPNGAYVQPHMQTNPNDTPADNWTTRGNVNPYTGRPGYRSPY